MPVLASLKRRETHYSKNADLQPIRYTSMTCAYIALITFAGLKVNAALPILIKGEDWLGLTKCVVAAESVNCQAKCFRSFVDRIHNNSKIGTWRNLPFFDLFALILRIV
jgi:hypothetical protein